MTDSLSHSLRDELEAARTVLQAGLDAILRDEQSKPLSGRRARKREKAKRMLTAHLKRIDRELMRQP